MKRLFLASAMWLVGGQALACTPIAFGKFKVGQTVTRAQVAELSAKCVGPNECEYSTAAGITYVVTNALVREVSAPVRVAGVPVPAKLIDAAYARRVNRKRCQTFSLRRDDAGKTYLETAERVDPISKQSVRVTLYRDERGTPLVAITSLPDV